MNRDKKLLLGLGIVVLAIICSVTSLLYLGKFTTSGVNALVADSYSFNSANVHTVNDLNFYISKGKLSGLSFNRAPISSPTISCSASATIPSQVGIISRGWPMRYAYEVPSIFCSSGNYWTYLPIAFALNTLIYILIFLGIIFIRNKTTKKKKKLKVKK